MKPCFMCNESGDKRVPLLICHCYLCPPCYCITKGMQINYCVKCSKTLMRGKKKNA